MRHGLAIVLLIMLIEGCKTPAVAPHANVAPPGPSAGPTSAPPAQTGWRVVNLMPVWWDYWARAADEPRAEQIALFEAYVVSPYPKLFAQNVVGRGDPAAPFDRQAQISAYLDTVPALLPVMRQLSQSIEDELPAHRQTFMSAFPDFSWKGEVYFTISLDAFDGSVREIDGAPTLLFGVDKIARLYGVEADLAPLFHHELFHILHLIEHEPFDPQQKNRMYQALWAEGLAVHVAHELNPAASHAQLVLSDEMVERGDRQLKQLALEMLDNLDAQDPVFYRDWFRGAGQRDDIPRRVGYYLGYRVAGLMGKSRSLSELAALKDPELRREIEAALRELAGG